MLKTGNVQAGKIIEVRARFQNDYHFPQFIFKEAVFELMSFLNEQSQGAGFGLDSKFIDSTQLLFHEIKEKFAEIKKNQERDRWMKKVETPQKHGPDSMKTTLVKLYCQRASNLEYSSLIENLTTD